MPTPTLLSAIFHSVDSALQAGQVGTPVFVRCVAQIATNHADLPESLRAITAMASVWLSAPPRRVYVLGGAETGQATATIQYPGGQSALVSVHPVPAGGAPRVDLMLLGNTGALYHEGGVHPSEVWGPDDPYMDELPELSAGVWKAFEHSSRTGTVVDLEESRRR